MPVCFDFCDFCFLVCVCVCVFCSLVSFVFISVSWFVFVLKEREHKVWKGSRESWLRRKPNQNIFNFSNENYKPCQVVVVHTFHSSIGRQKQVDLSELHRETISPPQKTQQNLSTLYYINSSIRLNFHYPSPLNDWSHIWRLSLKAWSFDWGGHFISKPQHLVSKLRPV